MASACWILQFGQRYGVYIAADQLKSAQGETRGMGNESLRAWGTYDALTAVVNLWGGVLCKAGTTVGTVLRTQQSHGLLGHRILGIVSRQMAVEPGLVGLAGRGADADADRRERGRWPGRCKNVVYTQYRPRHIATAGWPRAVALSRAGL